MTALSKDQPYPGLRPFESGDEEFFFGREAQIETLRRKLGTSRLVAVVGRSGCGKSSLVRAGLDPLLGKELDRNGQPAWHVLTFRPQGRPIAELAKALFALAQQLEPEPEQSAESTAPPSAFVLKPSDTHELLRGQLEATLRRNSQGLVDAVSEVAGATPGRILVFIDQFEEIFRFEDTRGSNADEATAFVRLLIEAINSDDCKIDVMLAMRLDFLGDCARFPRLPEAISDGQFLVPNLDRAQRRAAIEEPARKGGRTISPALTQLLLNKIGEDPDELPVLQHVLMRTWQFSRGSEISLDDYRKTGGYDGAISEHATKIFDSLPDEQHRLAAERLFKAISERDRRGRALRRPQPFAEVVTVAGSPEAVVTRVIDAYRAPDCCFLMPPAGEPLTPSQRIDISHESLLRRWVKFTGSRQAPVSEGWLEEEDRAGKIYRQILDAQETGATLPSSLALTWNTWWKRWAINEAWAGRYGGNFEACRDFVLAQAGRQKYRRVAVACLLILVVLVVFGGFFLLGSLQQKRDLEARYNELAQDLRRLQQQRTDQQAQLRDQIREFDRAVRSVSDALPADVARKIESAAIAPDSVAQSVAGKDAPPAQPLAPGREGYMWIGSKDRNLLTSPAGDAVFAPAGPKVGSEYQVSTDIYLRSGYPDQTTYAQKPDLGVLLEDSRVKIVELSTPYARPTGEQYWAKISVVTLGLPVVYFQFAGGTREQAQAFSKALHDKGYKIPGEERDGGAAGLREVRWYKGSVTAANKLADSVNTLLKDLGYSTAPPVKVVKQQTTGIKKNPDGNLELWLELPPK